MTQQDAPQFLICLLQTAEVLSTELSPQKQTGNFSQAGFPGGRIADRMIAI